MDSFAAGILIKFCFKLKNMMLVIFNIFYDELLNFRNLRNYWSIIWLGNRNAKLVFIYSDQRRFSTVAALRSMLWVTK